MNGGRVQSISVNPREKNHIIIATRFGGLWKTENGGTNWVHLGNLSSVLVVDVAYGSNGNTVIATCARDNRAENGGGIWVSHDGGISWSKPSTADPPPSRIRVRDRISAYGISYSPDDPNKVYVGTDCGVATSKDNGKKWSHEILPYPILSIAGLSKNRVMGLSRHTLQFRDATGLWKNIRGGLSETDKSFKNIDLSPSDATKVFIFCASRKDLLLYNMASSKMTTITVPIPKGSLERPASFVRISKSSVVEGAIDIWVGAGVNLLKSTWLEDVEFDSDFEKRAKINDWITLNRSAGIHENCGYLGLDISRRPVLYGCSGGIFKPTNKLATEWTRAATYGSGFNSYEVTDLAGTNVKSPPHIQLYFAAEDNGIWSSPDGGTSWPSNSSRSGFSGPPYNDCRSGFSLQVRKDADSDKDITFAYSKFECGDIVNVFADANLLDHRPVLDVDITGAPLSEMSQAFFVSPDNWIRYRESPHPPWEIYFSQNNGSNWRKIARVLLKIKGTLAVSGFGIHSIVYAPLADTRFHSSGGEIIGLAKLTGLLGLDVRTYDDTNLIYLPDGGSLGQRATEFESHAVFGVDPRDPNFIIAPDIYNQIIKVSHDGGVSWTTDKNLTEEVTKRGDLLLYDRDPYHMQVTQISFDPYNERRILIGTRDSGIIVSENSGTSWWSLKDSEQITYITGFFFARDNSVIVSSYGRGLWKIDLNPPFPFERYCDGDCTIRFPFKLEPAEEPPDWIDKDVIVFLKGRINGIVLSGRKVKKVTVSPGTIFKRYRGETQEYHKIDITESKRGMGFKGMKGVIAAIQKGEVVKALIIKENELFGIISGQQEFSDMH